MEIIARAKGLNVNRLTIAPTRCTLKLIMDMPLHDQKRYIEFTKKVLIELGDVNQTMRCAFEEHDGILYANMENDSRSINKLISEV